MSHLLDLPFADDITGWQFFLSSACYPVSVFDCCSVQPPGTGNAGRGNEMIIVLLEMTVRLRETKRWPNPSHAL